MSRLVKRKHEIIGATYKDSVEIASIITQILMDHSESEEMLTLLVASNDGNIYFETVEVVQ